ncbi:MAG: proteinase IV [Clostridiaceae bacterium]|nr:proteinase IV [Clostridiaceae bacterium]
MKKFLACIIVLVMLFGCFNVYAYIHVEGNTDAIIGDVDGNGEVDSIDFMYIRKYLVGQINRFPVESGFYCADVDGNGEVDSIDFAYLRKYLLGMINGFPKESDDEDTSTPTPTPSLTPTPSSGHGLVDYYYVNNIDVGKNPGVEIFVNKSPESKISVSARTVSNGPIYADGWAKTNFRLGGNAINGVDYEAIDFDYFWREIGIGMGSIIDDNPRRGFYIIPIDTGTDETKYLEIYFDGFTEPNAIIHFVKDLAEDSDDVDTSTPTPRPTPTFIPYSAAVNKEFVNANTQFAANLFKKLSEEDADTNIFFSPFSISMALSMPYQGAETTTKEAMAKTLNYTGISTEEINQSYVEHLSYFKRLYPQLTLDVANSIWVQKGFEVKESFLEKNKEVFNAKSSFLNFRDNDACDTMNKWISDATKGKINNLINPPIDESVKMYLMNAIYFNASWTDQFNEEQTSQGVFKNIQGKNKVVWMMNRIGGYNYAKTQEFQAIELPYCARNISMYCILPQNNNVNDFIAEFDVDKWNEIKSNLSRKSNVSVSIPRFKNEYKPENLKGKLAELGMEEAFSEGADFSGIAKDSYIDDVLHKAVIEMTESGTEAAASTVISIVTPSIPESFVADNPFMYVIADNETGTILFMGKVVDF